MAIARDGCVVDTEPLSELVHGFVSRWNRDRPQRSGQFRKRSAAPAAAKEQQPDVDPIGAVAWLAQETGLPRDTIQNIAARPPRYRTTGLAIADSLVSALGRPEAFHDGTLSIRPNPNAPRAARAACCGGSMTF